MIIESKAGNKIMAALVENWFDSFSAYELAKKANVTNPLVYSLLPKLLDKGIINEKNRRISLNRSNLFVYRYKLLFDADKLLELPKKERNIIDEVFISVKRVYKKLNAFILIGSIAEPEHKPADIDFLVIGEKEKGREINYHRLLRLANINIIEKSQEEINKDFLDTDDFLISSLSSNIIFYDDGTFKKLLQQELPFPSKDVIDERKEQLFKMEKRVKLLLKDKDRGRLVQEFKKFLIKKARIILLEHNIIPLSKPHILQKIKKIEPKINKLYCKINNKNILNEVAKYV